MFRDLLPPIPNLEIGYLWNYANKARSGRLTVDYVRPFTLSPTSVIYGEAHGEFSNFLYTVKRIIGLETAFTTTDMMTTTTGLTSVNERIDLSFGGGYRRLFRDGLLLGLNAFYDTSKLAGQWYGGNALAKWYGGSGLGIEIAALVSGSDAIDLNFNYYGSLFSGRNSIVNAFRNGGGNFDLETGYSHQLYTDGPDLRVKLTGYQFDIGRKVYGWNAGTELTTRDGMFCLRVDAGKDKINDTYYTVGGFVNVGFQLENLFSGESPFTTPEPIFKCTRNLKSLLAKKAKRNWHQPAAVMLARSQEIVTALPTFQMTITGNLIGTSTFDPDSAVWTLNSFGAQVNSGCIALFGPGGAVRAAAYTVSLVGDTSRLTFPLTFTLTPIPDTSPGHGLVGILVNNFPGGGCVAGSLNAPLTAPAATLATPSSVFDSSGFVFGRPIVFVKNPLPAAGGNIGTFLITADPPNNVLVAPLIVRIVAGP